MREKNIHKEINFIPRYHCFMELFPLMEIMSSSPAILAPDRAPLLYGSLCRQIEYTTSFLNNHGLGRNDRIAVIVPSGPEMAVLFLGIISGSTFVPLRPDYVDQGYDSCISHFKIDALIVQSDIDSHLTSIAKKRGISLIELTPLQDSEAGLFTLKWIFGDKFRKCEPGVAYPDDSALILETSGTTSQPKIVPLSQDNIFASAHYIKTSLHLTIKDRCLNIMPMYHITGLVSPILSTLSVGGSVICTPGVSMGKFFDWLKIFKPTWYSSVPAIHQSIIEKAEELSFNSIQTSLRFVRSTSSSLPKSLFEKLGAVFNCPVIQTYALTEALPIASTPFHQHAGKAMSVGVPVSDLAIIDENGTMAGQGQIGEILVRGPQVFRGYEDNPAATGVAFFNEWFKTGDLGYLDDERYLYIAGRLKEIINRGGQKVSPSEVEAVLISHPSVREAAVFGTPHLRLGEAVVAAVVMNDAQTLTASELRQYSTKKLAPFKVPQQIIIVEEIPKGPLGKFQRNKFFQNFSHLLKPAFEPPSTEIELTLADIWKDVLGVGMIGKLDNFFTLGGDSLHGMQVLSLVKKRLDIALPAETIFRHPTLREMADFIRQYRRSEGKADRLSALLALIELLTEEEAKNILLTKDEEQ
jgi:acyl-CoA synthetase (AMP-forming)/AMP-acid ligase II/acyl carrier protein